jgi:hypothetical protein
MHWVIAQWSMQWPMLNAMVNAQWSMQWSMLNGQCNG